MMRVASLTGMKHMLEVYNMCSVCYRCVVCVTDVQCGLQIYSLGYRSAVCVTGAQCVTGMQCGLQVYSIDYRSTVLRVFSWCCMCPGVCSSVVGDVRVHSI